MNAGGERKIAWATIVQIAGRAVQWGIAALTTKTIATFLAPEAMGQLGMLDEYTLFIAVVANLGIFGNLVRRLSDHPTDGRLFGSALAVRAVTAVACYAVAWILLALNVSDSVRLVTGAFLAATLALDLVLEVFVAAMQVHYRMGHAVLAIVLCRALEFGGVLAYTRLAPSNDPAFALPSIAAIQFAALVAIMPVMRAFLRPHLPGPWIVDWPHGWTFLRGGLVFGVIGIINSLSFRYLPDLVAAHALTDAEFATFNLSFRIALILSLFSTFFMYAVLPQLRAALDRNAHVAVRRLIRLALVLTGGGGVLLVAGGALFGPQLLALVSHAKYVLPGFDYVLPLMLLLTAVSWVYDVVLLTLYAWNADGFLLRIEAVAFGAGCCVFAIGCAAPAPHGGLIAAITGALVAETTVVALGLRRIRSRLAARG